MPPDLPASLIVELLNWVACDECGGTGCTTNVGGHTGEDLSRCRCLCTRPHTVVVYEGRRIHADPERVTRWCAKHGEPMPVPKGSMVVDPEWCIEGVMTQCWDEPDYCRLVLRPVVPLDLEEA